MKIIAKKTHYANQDYIVYNDILINYKITNKGARIFSSINLKNYNVLNSKSFNYVRKYIDNQFTFNPLTGTLMKKKYC